jgi:hypothetical protein
MAQKHLKKTEHFHGSKTKKKRRAVDGSKDGIWHLEQPTSFP